MRDCSHPFERRLLRFDVTATDDERRLGKDRRTPTDSWATDEHTPHATRHR